MPLTKFRRAPQRVCVSVWLAICLLPWSAIESGPVSGLLEAFQAATVGLEELFVVVPVTERKVLCAGRDAAGAVSVRAFDHDRNETQILVTEDSFFSDLVRTPWHVEMGVARVRSEPGEWLAVVLYQAEDRPSSAVSYETHMRLLLLDETGLAWSRDPEKIAETSVSYWETDPAGKWLLARVGSAVGEDGVGEPAVKELARVFARDATGDGFPDVVVWKRTCRSVLASEAGRRDAECGLGLEPVEQVTLIAAYGREGRLGALRAGEVAGLRNRRAWESGLGSKLYQDH